MNITLRAYEITMRMKYKANYEMNDFYWKPKRTLIMMGEFKSKMASD